MKNYIASFTSMVEDIRRRSFLEVVEFSFYPPATDETISAVEQKLGAKLTESIYEFYSQTDGMRLHWRIKPDLSDEEVSHLSDIYDDYWPELPEEQDNPFAQINLLPIEETFIERNWEELIIPLEYETVDFSGATYLHSEFARRLKPFDLFSSYYCMAFFVDEGVGNPKVLLLSDYYAEWYYSRITDFESYLEMLLATRGIVASRDDVYSEYRGDLKPPLITNAVYWTEERIPKLFRKIAS